MQWQYMLTFNVLNARIHILEGVKTVLKPWVNNKLQAHLKLNNWYAPTVAKSRFKIAQNMGMISSNLNVNFVAQPLNGFAGETLTFVNPVIKGSAMAIMWVSIRKINCLNAKGLVNVQQEVIIMGMERKKV